MPVAALEPAKEDVAMASTVEASVITSTLTSSFSDLTARAINRVEEDSVWRCECRGGPQGIPTSLASWGLDKPVELS